jgi:hypothetical protein
LMIAGFLTVVVILLSQTLFFPAENSAPTSKSHSTTEQAPVATILPAPADVVLSPSVQLDEISPTAIKTSVPDTKDAKPFFLIPGTFSTYFNILFRAIISPNAP